MSFGHAAERLHITQPSLSLQIQSLEQTIGAKLFVRRLHVRLTKAGITINVVQEASVIQTQNRLVESDLGITVVPAGVRCIQVSGVVYHDLRSKDSSTEIAFFWREDRTLPMVNALLEDMLMSDKDDVMANH